MANYFIAVNKSGSTLTVKNWNGTSTIGKINARECFGIQGADEGSTYDIRFRNSSGQIVDGVINIEEVNFNTAAVTPISNYPSSTINLWDYLAGGNKAHHVYNTRKALTIYDAGGQVWGSVAANAAVAAKATYEGQNGVSHPEWLQINYVKSSSGVWVSINDAFGFVPMLSEGSLYNTIAVYGSW
jgi:hypothetical protein